MPLVLDAPSSADAWCKLHESLKDRAVIQDPLHSALAVSFDELGDEQRGRFLKLAVLANGVPASKEMLGNLWEQAGGKMSRGRTW